MVSIFAKACICRGNTQVHLQFLQIKTLVDIERPSCYANGSLSASSKISFHGLPSKSKRPSIRKHSIVVIITVNSISFYETAIYREIFSKYFLASIFEKFQKILAAHQNTLRKVLETSQKYTRGKVLFSKVAGFYRSNYPMRSVKKVFLERCSQNSQEKACVRDSILIKLHS